MFLVAQPFGQQGTIPGAEQGADEVPPVAVTAAYRRVDCEPGSGGSEGTREVDGPLERVYGSTCTFFYDWSDPRLQGTETYVENFVEHTDGEVVVYHYVHSIVTDDGAWRGRPQLRFTSEVGPEDFSGTWVLDGEGAYDGLIAVRDFAGPPSDVSGFIISHDLPPAPVGPSTE